MKPEFADAFLPSGHARLVAYGGRSHAQAFDELAATAALPAFQQMVREFQATTDGRALLRQVRSSWGKEGLPCPWDNVLDLTLT